MNTKLRLLATLILAAGVANIATSANAAAPANDAKNTTYVYKNATELPVYGQLTTDTFEPFSRLPESMKDTVRPAVWRLGRNSAGIYVRFTSDAGDLNFKWRSTFGNNGDNMTGITQRGMALYVLEGDTWYYLTSIRPRRAPATDKAATPVPNSFLFNAKASKLAGESHEYMLYLSLYDGVLDLEIGVPEGCTLAGSTLNSPRVEKPVIAYGTSILQGASASHPGLCGTAQLSRRLDRLVINLGFSGNCLLEEPIAEYMASYPDPGVYLIDNWNGKAEIGEKGLEKCIRILLAAHPETPVIVVDRAVKPAARFDETTAIEFTSKEKVAYDVVRKLRAEGYKKVYHITPEVLGAENSGSSDGTHFTDEAFTRWCDAVWPVIRKCYK